MVTLHKVRRRRVVGSFSSSPRTLLRQRLRKDGGPLDASIVRRDRHRRGSVVDDRGMDPNFSSGSLLFGSHPFFLGVETTVTQH